MATPLPKPPETSKQFGREMYLWLNRVYMRLSGVAQIVWASIDYSGSNLTDLETRNHNDTQNIGGADDTDTDATKNKHISNLQAKTWTDNDAKEADTASSDATKDKHVSNLLAKGWEDTKTNYTTHAAASNAHGATGNVLGTGNTASAGTRGPVYQAAANTDASSSTVTGSTSAVSVTSADATDLASCITLANELKADVNQLVSDVNTLAGDLDSAITDLNAAITTLNNLHSKMRTAEQLST